MHAARKEKTKYFDCIYSDLLLFLFFFLNFIFLVQGWQAGGQDAEPGLHVCFV